MLTTAASSVWGQQLNGSDACYRDATTFTEKTLKVGGGTSLLDAGEPLENVQVVGGWQPGTPYKCHFTTETLRWPLRKGFIRAYPLSCQMSWSNAHVCSRDRRGGGEGDVGRKWELKGRKVSWKWKLECVMWAGISLQIYIFLDLNRRFRNFPELCK